MKKITRITIIGIMTVMLAAFTGCTTAGPFVTSISSDGKGNLIIEKNTVEYNDFTGNISSGGNPTTQVIRVLPESDQQQK